MDNVSDVNTSTAPAYVTHAQYSGFWRRFAAYLIDVIIILLMIAILVIAPLTVISISAGSALEWYIYIVEMAGIIVIYLIYDTIFLSSGMMATPGKRLLGIKVTDLNGNCLSFPRALLRTIFKFGFAIVSALIPAIDIISLVILLNPFLITLTEKKQAIHDFIAGTIVVRK